ncbi:MAG: hypothetical protein RLY70_929, partial [Planctomycetota bacterium]
GTGITTESPASLPKHRLAPASTARESVASAPPATREAMDHRDMTGNRETKGILDATGPHRTTDSRDPTKAHGTADARDSLDARDTLDARDAIAPHDSLHSLDATETVSVDVKGVERVWRIRTHELEDPGAQLRTDSLDIQRSEHDEWLSASIDELLREAALRRTLIYVHGNRGADAQAVARGAELARQLAARPGAPPFQVVIWSWPSAKTLRGRRDFLHKSERTDTEAWYLAGLLQRFPSDANVSILGFSYGARVVTGAAQWLAGGRFEDRELPILRTPNGDPRTSVRLRVALAAPAMHWHWIGQDSLHNRALEVIDRMTILYNPSDPALRWFKLIYPCERPQALGRVGISDERLGAAATRVDQWNIEPAVGRAHDEELILRSPTVIELIGGALMDSPPSSVVEQEAAKR